MWHQQDTKPTTPSADESAGAAVPAVTTGGKGGGAAAQAAAAAAAAAAADGDASGDGEGGNASRSSKNKVSNIPAPCRTLRCIVTPLSYHNNNILLITRNVCEDGGMCMGAGKRADSLKKNNTCAEIILHASRAGLSLPQYS